MCLTAKRTMDTPPYNFSSSAYRAKTRDATHLVTPKNGVLLWPPCSFCRPQRSRNVEKWEDQPARLELFGKNCDQWQASAVDSQCCHRVVFFRSQLSSPSPSLPALSLLSSVLLSQLLPFELQNFRHLVYQTTCSTSILNPSSAPFLLKPVATFTFATRSRHRTSFGSSALSLQRCV